MSQSTTRHGFFVRLQRVYLIQMALVSCSVLPDLPNRSSLYLCILHYGSLNMAAWWPVLAVSIWEIHGSNLRMLHCIVFGDFPLRVPVNTGWVAIDFRSAISVSETTTAYTVLKLRLMWIKATRKRLKKEILSDDFKKRKIFWKNIAEIFRENFPPHITKCDHQSC
jgi:hypothetical protein